MTSETVDPQRYTGTVPRTGSPPSRSGGGEGRGSPPAPTAGYVRDSDACPGRVYLTPPSLPPRHTWRPCSPIRASPPPTTGPCPGFLLMGRTTPLANGFAAQTKRAFTDSTRRHFCSSWEFPTVIQDKEPSTGLSRRFVRLPEVCPLCKTNVDRFARTNRVSPLQYLSSALCFPQLRCSKRVLQKYKVLALCCRCV